MSRLTAILTAGLILFVWGCEFDVLAGHVHEDFEKTVQLDIDGEFSLENVNGSIQVETWDRDEVRIKGRKKASSEKLLKQIEIEVTGLRKNPLPFRRGSYQGMRECRGATLSLSLGWSEDVIAA